MEKTISVEERIRRAEEIYARRKNYNTSTSVPYARVSVGEKRRAHPLKKMFIQIFISALIYASFYIIENGNYIFTEQIIAQIKQVLEYDMNIQNVSQDILSYINEIRNKNVIIPEENRENEQENSEAEESENKEQTEENNIELEQMSFIEETTITDESIEISQEQSDADYIKANYSIIKPLTGTITSRFGNRNPTTETVPKYHTGIDIAREKGTIIVAAMEGEVTQVSSVGDYGNHIRIANGDVITLYAHCDKIYVKEGDYITQGQEIAEVGETGNATGPHLHFEIRRNDNIIDPDLILEF